MLDIYAFCRVPGQANEYRGIYVKLRIAKIQKIEDK